MSFLRYLMLLALIVWIGGLFFFAFVLAPTAFSLLPSRQMAGMVVGESLKSLHWIGVFSGLIFLGCSTLHSHFKNGAMQIFAARNVLVFLMIVLTLISQFGVIPRMDALRASISGEIDSVPPDNPARAKFDALHRNSTRLEGGVLLLGLMVVYLAAGV